MYATDLHQNRRQAGFCF